MTTSPHSPPLDPYGAYRERRHFANLDGLRCLSILGVLWYHMPIAWPGRPLPLARGFLGVDLFFVISGFLITTLLLRERERHGRIALGAFYIRRTLRIFPLYYAVLAAMTLWVANESVLSLAGADQRFFEHLPYYLTYTANLAPEELIFSPSWSLATEEQFYLLWPPLLALAALPLRWVMLVALLGTSVAANFGALHSLGLHPAFAAAGCTPILLGLFLAFALHDRSWHHRLAPLLAPPWAIALPMALLMACLGAPLPTASIQPGDLRGWPRIGVHLAFAWGVGCCVLRETGPVSTALQWGPARWIGRISYGIYLMQIPVLLFISLQLLAAHGRIDWQGSEGLWLGLAFVGTSILLATVSWFTLERGFLRLKGRFQR